MHTHFASATHSVATLLTVLIAGTFWRIAWMHVLAAGTRRNVRILTGLAKAALLQY